MRPASIRVKVKPGTNVPVPGLKSGAWRLVGRPYGSTTEELPFEEVESQPLHIFNEIVRHVKFGDLLPADEATAKFCGVPFSPPPPEKKSAARSG